MLTDAAYTLCQQHQQSFYKSELYVASSVLLLYVLVPGSGTEYTERFVPKWSLLLAGSRPASGLAKIRPLLPVELRNTTTNGT